MNHPRPVRTATTLAAFAIALVVAACTSAGGPGSSPSAPPSSGLGVSPSGAPASTAPSSDPTGGGAIIGPGAARLVVPKPGQLEPRPIGAETFIARVDGRRVAVTVTWTSGVEPCNVLDHVEVRRDGQAFAITLFEGHGPGDQVCIMIAEQHRTEVDLSNDDLAPGTYTVSDGTGTAPAIQVVVS